MAKNTAKSIIVNLTNVRLAFPDLFVPSRYNDASPLQYGAVFLIKKGDKNHKAVQAAYEEVAESAFGDQAGALLRRIKENPQVNCFTDGDLKEHLDGYAGHMSLSSKNKKRPTVVDRDRTPLTEDDGKPYAGCMVNAKVELWAQANEHGKAMRASLLGVQFAGDNDSFGGGGKVASAEDFPDLGVDEDETDADEAPKKSARSRTDFF